MIPPVVASERGTAQTSWRRKALAGVVGPRHCTANREQKHFGKCDIIDGDSPVCEAKCRHSGILSNAGHEESCANLPGPSGKAKYSRETDSERVL